MKKYCKSATVKHWVGVVVIGVVLGLGLQFARAWTEPSATPPGGNVGAPINTGGTTQTKSGDICTTYGGTTKCLSSAGGGGGGGDYDCVCKKVQENGHGQTYVRTYMHCDDGSGWDLVESDILTISRETYASAHYFPCSKDNPSSSFLYGDTHSSGDCSAVGGTTETIEGKQICRVKYSTPQKGCPSGWTQYKNWSATSNTPVTCSDCTSCTVTGGHPWGNTAIERCTYKADQLLCWLTTNVYCYAKVSEIACY